MIIHIFGRKNLVKFKYSGKEGLEIALSELLLIYKETNKIPTCRTKNISGICNAAFHGKWSELGINGWNDLKKKN